MSAALLALDTATSRVVVALGTPEGELLAHSAPEAGHRHGELLLATVARLLDEHGLARQDLAGIVAGTGPGAFTGLRVGLATAKALAHGLRLPLAAISTAEALIAASGALPGRVVLLIPAGPSDRVLVRSGEPPRLLPAGQEPDLDAAERLVAVDLGGRAPDEAVVAGGPALDGLAAALCRLGAARLRDGGDEPAAVVPQYVTLPRGVAVAAGEVSWSRDPR